MNFKTYFQLTNKEEKEIYSKLKEAVKKENKLQKIKKEKKKVLMIAYDKPSMEWPKWDSDFIARKNYVRALNIVYSVFKGTPYSEVEKNTAYCKMYNKPGLIENPDLNFRFTFLGHFKHIIEEFFPIEYSSFNLLKYTNQGRISIPKELENDIISLIFKSTKEID